MHAEFHNAPDGPPRPEPAQVNAERGEAIADGAGRFKILRPKRILFHVRPVTFTRSLSAH